jgi:hypothetical protein
VVADDDQVRRVSIAVTGAVLGFAAVAVVVGPDAGTASPGHAAVRATAQRPVPGTGCEAFPTDDVWHASVRRLPVAARSAAWVRHIGLSRDLHPDFGPSYGAQPVPYGIPVTVVSGSHRTVPVRFAYPDESDRVRYPLGSDTRIEGGRAASGDRHAVVVDTASCRLYELFDLRHTSAGWTAGSGATWSLRSDALRPKGWTSADAAGLAILPGLLRWDEVKSGHVDHAIRFTAPVTSKRYLWPARHEAGSTRKPDVPPMGARFRLKAGFPISGYAKDTRVVLRAMKTYGLILADNGSPWFFQGESSSHWPNRLLDQLKTVPARAFQAVDESSLRQSPNSGRAVARRPPKS